MTFLVVTLQSDSNVLLHQAAHQLLILSDNKGWRKEMEQTFGCSVEEYVGQALASQKPCWWFIRAFAIFHQVGRPSSELCGLKSIRFGFR